MDQNAYAVVLCTFRTRSFKRAEKLAKDWGVPLPRTATRVKKGLVAMEVFVPLKDLFALRDFVAAAGGPLVRAQLVKREMETREAIRLVVADRLRTFQ
jgi:hypothetical protein